MTLKKLDISKAMDDFLEMLPPKQFKQVFTTIIDLRKNHQPHDSSKLKGYLELYRVDIGEYRIIYSFDEDVVNIIVCGKRNDDNVYKKLGRK
jgi:mRNA interferase RelE/StbE